MPDLNDIIWAAQIFRNLDYNSPLIDIFKNVSFTHSLRYAPQELQVSDVRQLLLRFLNKWKCRLKDDNTTANNLKNCIVDAHPELLSIQTHSILDFDFENDSNRGKIENIYDKFKNYGITHNYSPACISKTIYVINPNLFVMWDNQIAYNYCLQNRDIKFTGRGYCSFLIDMKIIAKQLVDECMERFNTDDPALLISQNLNINPPLSLVKFIDEFNYLVFTKGLSRPQDWVCPF